jgi:hypothetical protein
MMSLQIGLLTMKKPRFDYYATSENQEKSIKQLHSPLDNMPTIIPSEKRQASRDQIQKSGNPDILNSRNHEIMKSRLPETLKSGKEESMKSRKVIKKYSTQLTPDSIIGIQRIALDEGKKDYEVLQEAVDRFLKKRGV